MPGQLGRNQMVGVTAWRGTVTKDNHLYGLFNKNPQRADEVMTVLMSSMHLPTMNSYLSTQVPVKYYDDDTDIFWDVITSSRRNIPLVEARRADGTVVTADSANVGMGFEPFYLVFNTDWFAIGEVLWGNLNETYPVIVKEAGKVEGTNVVYKVEPFGANGGVGIPAARLLEGERFSYAYAPVEDSFSRKVGDVRFSTPTSMRSDFSRVRLQFKVGGKDMGSKLAANIPVSCEVNGKMVTKIATKWMHAVTWKVEETFNEYKNNALLRGVSTRFENGEYSNFGLSGLPNKQGAGFRELMKYGRVQYYNHLSLKTFQNLLMELFAGKVDFKERKVTIVTGERGKVQLSNLFDDALASWTKIYGSRDANPANVTKGPETNYTNGNARTFVTEDYTRWIGPMGIEANIIVDSSYDDDVTNKIQHPNGGPAESYRYDIFAETAMDGGPNVQKCMVKNEPDYRGYVWGPFYNPFTGDGNNMSAGTDEDAATVHYKSTLGILMRDPSRVVSLIPKVLEG